VSEWLYKAQPPVRQPSAMLGGCLMDHSEVGVDTECATCLRVVLARIVRRGCDGDCTADYPCGPCIARYALAGYVRGGRDL
jgi:hypothetical protein